MVSHKKYRVGTRYALFQFLAKLADSYFLVRKTGTPTLEVHNDDRKETRKHNFIVRFLTARVNPFVLMEGLTQLFKASNTVGMARSYYPAIARNATLFGWFFAYAYALDRTGR